MWDLPGPGLEPMSPALAGRFLTTAPPGKSHPVFLKNQFLHVELYSQSIWMLFFKLDSFFSGYKVPYANNSDVTENYLK